MDESTTRPTRAAALVREQTDRAVLVETVTAGRATRAGLAKTTGYSKPTISESVRRLESVGLLEASGEEGGRRGRVATWYRIAARSGWVLALDVNQAGVHARACGLGGVDFHDEGAGPTAAGDVAALTASVRAAITRAREEAVDRGPLRCIAIAVANPVDPATGEIVALPHTPFPEGLLDPRHLLDGQDPPYREQVEVLVDNDVNLATRAEYAVPGVAASASSLGYLYVGAGIGAGLWARDGLIRGAGGLAGELGYLSDGPGRPTLANTLAALGLQRGDAPANDVDAVLEVLDRAAAGESGAVDVREAIVAAMAGALCAVTVVVNPDLVLLGGPIGRRPDLLQPVRDELARRIPITVRIETGRIAEAAPLVGAVSRALERGREVALQQAVRN